MDNSYICLCCKEKFDINEMYLMCINCNEYVTCYECSIPLKNESINYKINLSHCCEK